MESKADVVKSLVNGLHIWSAMLKKGPVYFLQKIRIMLSDLFDAIAGVGSW